MTTDDDFFPHASKRRRQRVLGKGLDAIMSPPDDVEPSAARYSLLHENFTLMYELPAGETAAKAIEKLGAADLTGAFVGAGENGRIALRFDNDGPSALSAVAVAIARVAKAHPGLLMRALR